jgi:hypothetical protein
MMATFFLTLLVVILSVLALAIGVVFRRAPLTGSCGGRPCGQGFDCAVCPTRARRQSND